MTQRKTALIVGLGQTGAACARWLGQQGYALRLLDTRETPPGIEALRLALGDAVTHMHLGEEAVPDALLEGVNWIVPSPGMSPLQAPLADWLSRAREAGAQVIGEAGLFALALADLKTTRGYEPRLIGITGTNGKTTVTALARHMFEQAGVSVCAAGNISPSMLEALMLAVEEDALPQVWVLELSSFQLCSAGSLRLDVGTVLNISQDHLDWHGDMDYYVAAKAAILGMSDTRVVNRDDAAVLEMAAPFDADTIRSFGTDEPLLAGDVGVIKDGGLQWLAASILKDEAEPAKRTARRGGAEETAARKPGQAERLMPVDALQVTGFHNVSNVLAAALLCQTLDVEWPQILRAAQAYRGEPHRLQFVRTIRGVDFFNDSKGTNVGATLAGLAGLGRPAILIAGGVSKGQDFEPLARLLADRKMPVVLFGADAARLREALEAFAVVNHVATDLDDAVRKAFSLATASECVVLSPACASFDMFRNYIHRGEAFVEAVRDLALDEGEVA